MTIDVSEIVTDKDGIRREYIREESGLTQLTQEQIDFFKHFVALHDIPGREIKLTFTVYGDIIKAGALQLAPRFQVFLYNPNLKKWEPITEESSSFNDTMTYLMDDITETMK